jgi:hypothetical protein
VRHRSDQQGRCQTVEVSVCFARAGSNDRSDLDKVVDTVATLVLVVGRSGESSASSKGGEEGGEGLHFVVELSETSVLVTNE